MNILTLTTKIANFYHITYKTTYFSTLFGLAVKGYSVDQNSVKGSNLNTTDFSDFSGQSYSSTKAYLTASVPKIPPKAPPIQVIEVDIPPVVEPITPEVMVDSETSSKFMDLFLNSEFLSEFLAKMFSTGQGIGNIYPCRIVMWPIEMLNGAQDAVLGHHSGPLSAILTLFFLIGIACLCLSPVIAINTFADLIRLGISTAFQTVWIGAKGMTQGVWNVMKTMFGKICTLTYGFAAKTATKVHEYLMQYKLYALLCVALGFGSKTTKVIKTGITGFFKVICSVANAFYWWVKYLVNGSSAEYDPSFFQRFWDFGLFMKSWVKGRSSLSETDQKKLDSVLRFLRGDERCLLAYDELHAYSLLSDEEEKLFLNRGMEKVVTELDSALAELVTPTVAEVKKDVVTTEILLHRVSQFLSNLHSRNYRDFQEFSCHTRLALGYDATWIKQSQARLGEIAESAGPLTTDQVLELVKISSANKTVKSQLIESNKVIEMMLNDSRVPLEIRNCFPTLDVVVQRYLSELKGRALDNIIVDGNYASRGTSPQSTESTEIPQGTDATEVTLREGIASGSSTPIASSLDLVRESPVTPTPLGTPDSVISEGLGSPLRPHMYERLPQSNSEYVPLLGPASETGVGEELLAISDDPMLTQCLTMIQERITAFMPRSIDNQATFDYFRSILGGALPATEFTKLPENLDNLHVLSSQPILNHQGFMSQIPVPKPPQGLSELLEGSTSASTSVSSPSTSTEHPLQRPLPTTLLNKETGKIIPLETLTPQMQLAVGHLAKVLLTKL